MSVLRAVQRFYLVGAYWLSWLIFGTVGLALNLACVPLLVVPGRSRYQRVVREVVGALFRAWCAWLHATRLCYIEWVGFSGERLHGPAIYAANHPGLLDATFLLARLPDTICIFKRRLIRNPAIGPAALAAGYAAGDPGADLIRDVALRVRAGRSVLIFPEGTRTASGVPLNPLKPGFALIAARAQASIRPIAITAPRDLIPKGRPWWRAPAVLPARVRIELLPEIRPGTDESSGDLADRVAREITAALALGAPGTAFEAGEARTP